MSDSEKFDYFAYHQIPESLDRKKVEIQVINLLNETWSRSSQLRRQQLSRSAAGLPAYLIFAHFSDRDPSEFTVYGHSQVAKITAHPTAVVIQSVVVAVACRGKGYGRRVMEGTESFIRQLAWPTTIYLSTTDKQDFYRHLGYTECAPPANQLLGAYQNDVEESEELLKNNDNQTEEPTNTENCLRKESDSFDPSTPIAHHNAPLIPPVVPPPPPPPQLSSLKTEVHTWLKKTISK